MTKTTTFIKIDRNIRRWRWYQDANTLRVFLDLLIEANIGDRDFMNVAVSRGQTVTSYEALAKRLRLSVQNVRTAFDHLRMTGEIETKAYNRFQLVTIVNYDVYQQKPKAQQRDKNADCKQIVNNCKQNVSANRQLTGSLTPCLDTFQKTDLKINRQGNRVANRVETDHDAENQEVVTGLVTGGLTDSQQAANRQLTGELTTLKEYIKKEKKEKNIYARAREDAAAAPLVGARGEYPEGWEQKAAAKGMTLEEYARWRNQ